jgi:HTH-type transcriptional regulator, competence development regulator
MSSLSYAKRSQPSRFGECLRQLRVGKDVPLRTVAAAADMDQAHLSKIELGQRVPTEEQTARLAKFFGLDETETQARRIAEKFHQEFQDNPKAVRGAICILAEGAGVYRAEKARKAAGTKAGKGSR